MNDIVVSVREVSRKFDAIYAVKGVSFDILKGQVVGFIGANGAGKTTTMRMMSTLDVPDQGNIEIFGKDSVKDVELVRSRLGWMPDHYGAYEYMTVYEYLDFFARAYGLGSKLAQQHVNDVMNFTELSDLSSRFIDSLSKGMGQRLCLARTLLHDPDLLILDEPAAGLDPKARIEFKRLVRLLAQDGKSIFISSHILSELEDMCDTLLFIDAGRIVHHGSADSLKRSDAQKTVVDVRLVGDVGKLTEWVSMQANLRVLEEIKGGLRIEIDNAESLSLSDLLKKLVKADFELYDFHEHQRKLEDAFVDILQGKKNK